MKKAQSLSKPNGLQRTAPNKKMSLRELRRIASQIGRARSQTKFERLRGAFIKGYCGGDSQHREPDKKAAQPKAGDSTKRKDYKKTGPGSLKLLPDDLALHNNFGEEWDGVLPPPPRMIESPSELLRQILESVRVTNRSWRYLYKVFRDADIELLRQAEKSFGGPAGAGAFLARPAHGLDGKIPILHTATKKGRAEVMLLMKRIDRGILA